MLCKQNLVTKYVGAATQVDLSSMDSQGCVFHNVIILILTVYYRLVQGYGDDTERVYISENIIRYLRLAGYDMESKSGMLPYHHEAMTTMITIPCSRS